tara:strand:- start:535 stop:1146 length:612 start_codon:yes stop_codon:yes gene_type:complete
MKIICIGRNFVDHAKELKNEIPKEPLFFLKPDSSILPKRNPFYIPNFSNNIHYEVELVVKICKLGKNIGLKFAPEYYKEIGLGIDFTARDIQDKCKAKGHPWEIAKSFDQSAVISNQFINKQDLSLNELNFSLIKNDEIVQKGTTSDMIFSIDQIICYVSKFMTLKIGDLIFTGTPKGVGKVNIGDTLIGKIEDKEMFKTKIK